MSSPVQGVTPRATLSMTTLAPGGAVMTVTCCTPFAFKACSSSWMRFRTTMLFSAAGRRRR
jgi:hypothetical protein